MRKIMFGTHVLVDLDELADKYTKEEIDNMISTVFVYKGTVATTGDLDSIENPKVGDCWNVEADGNNYAWNGSEWDKLGGTVDLSDYYTKTQVDAIKSALELQIQAVESLPTGGTEGQVLTKNSNTDGDASWKSFNSLVFKEHLDTPDDLPNLGQPSGVMGSKAYNFTYNFEVFSSRVSKKITNVSALEAITKAKGKYKYYVAGLAYETRAYVIGTNYPETVVIDYQGRPSIQATSEKPAEGFSFYTTMGIIEKTTNILIEDGFATNIPSIGIDPNYDTYYVERDNGSIYNYNVGMTLVGTSGESSYVVTDDIPKDLKAYNFYTVGNNNDMYVFNGNTFEVFSKSKVPTGGTTGQVLSKTGDGDYETAWKNVEGGSSQGITILKGNKESPIDLSTLTETGIYICDGYWKPRNQDGYNANPIILFVQKNANGSSNQWYIKPKDNSNGTYAIRSNIYNEFRTFEVALNYSGAGDNYKSASTSLLAKVIGNDMPLLTTLQTTDKSSLIAAINEIHSINIVDSLWTNSSPTSSLAPGNITLSSSTDDYDSIEFIFTDYIETNNYLSVTVPKGKNVNLSCNLYFAELMNYFSRIITYVNATTYNVKEGYNTSTAYQKPALHNDCCILQEIRGHKVIKSS